MVVIWWEPCLSAPTALCQSCRLNCWGAGATTITINTCDLGVGASFTGPVLDRSSGAKTLTSEITRSYVEPFLGLRLGLWLNDKALFTFRGTVGGFALFNDNNLDSDLELSFGYRVHKNIYAYLGYRARYDQFHTSELDFSAWLHGPIVGAVFAF